MIRISNLTKKYLDRTILDNVNINISKPGIYALIGESGCGKTTLINILGLMDEEFEGEYFFLDKNIKKIRDKDKELIRFNQIGYVYQNPKLIENESILVNVNIGLGREIKRKKLVSEMKKLNLNVNVKKKVSTLSGGERKRLSILISILKDPPLLLCDEITVGLDEENKILVMDYLIKLSKSKIIIMVTHDLQFVKKYVKKIYTINDKELDILEEGRIYENEINKKNNLSKKYINRHVMTHIKQKSGRTLISSLSMIIGLVSLGFSMMLTSSLKESISSSLGNNINDKQILVTKKEGTSYLNKNTTLNKVDLKKIKNGYNQFFAYEGVNYLNDIDKLFIDENYFTISFNKQDMELKDYSINCIKNAKYIENEDKNYIYAYKFELEEEEIIISFSKNQIYTYSKLLGIEYINDSSLKEYFKNNYLPLNVYIKNESWEYELKIELKVVGYYVDSTPTIYHSNSLWNEYIIEEVMQLESSYELDVIDEIPWMIKKIHYFRLKEEEEMNFINLYLSDLKMEEYQYGFIKEDDKLSVYFLYKHDNKFTKTSLDNLLNENLTSYIACSSSGYNVIGNALLKGYSFPTYISNEYNLLEEYIDYNSYSSSNLGMYQSTILTYTNEKLLPLGLLDSTSNSFVEVKSYVKEEEFIKGYYPKKYNEIIVSRALYNKLGFVEKEGLFSEKQVFFLTLKDIEYANGKYKNNYVIERLNICGVIESEEEYIYASPFWANTYLEIILQRSCQDYLIDSALFEYKGESVEEYIKYLNEKYPKYLFENPFLDYKKKVDETIGYVNLGLSLFSTFSLISSMLMMIVSSYLFVSDTKKEIGIYTFYGYNRKSIEKQVKSFGTFLSLYSSFLSSFVLIVMMVLLDRGVIGIEVPFNLDSTYSIVLINVIALIIGEFSSFLSSRRILKESPLKQLQEN